MPVERVRMEQTLLPTVAEDLLDLWRTAALDGFREALPMFGIDHLELLDEQVAAEELAGAYIAVDDEHHSYWVGILQRPQRVAQIATLLLGPAAPTAPWSLDESNDALREIANIVAGAVKTRMLARHGRLVLGLPFVVTGALAGEATLERRVAAVVAGGVTVHLSVTRRVHSPEKLRAIALERQLAEQEAKLAGILRAAADGIVTLTADGAIDTVNPAGARLLGLAAERCRGRQIAAFVPGWADCWRPRADAGGVEQCTGEAVVRRADGSEVPVELSIARFACKSGPMLAVVVRDVSERRAIEQERRRAQKIEAIGRLAAGLAHEINTPAQYAGDSADFVRTACAELVGLVRAYRGGVQELTAGPGHAEVTARLAQAEAAADFEFLAGNLDEACGRTRHGIDRIASIVAAMRSFAQPSDHATATTDLNELLRVTLTVGAAEYRHVADLTTDYGELPTIACQRADLGQVFLALIVNAAQAIADKQGRRGERGHLRIATRRERDGVAVTIADDGCGIADAIRDRVFDPFFTTRGVGGGQGQGLSQARTVVEQGHGGTIAFTSTAGVGTEFTVWLPVLPHGR